MQNRQGESKNMLSVQQVADRLGVSYDHVRALITNRKLQAVDLSDGKHRFYRVKPEWVDDLIADSELPALKPVRKSDNGNLRSSKYSKIGGTR